MFRLMATMRFLRSWIGPASGVLALALVASWGASPGAGPTHSSDLPPPAYEPQPLPSGIDSVTPLVEAAHAAAACGTTCRGVVYAWTPRMPLSRAAIPHIVDAARAVDLPLVLVSTEELLDYAAGRHGESGVGLPLADAMLAAGALAHAPALVVHEGQRAVGPAVLGYKRADAYESFLRERTGSAPRVPSSTSAMPTAHTMRSAWAPQAPTDYEVVGLPGAYFRWIPGTRQVAYESGRTIYFLDLDDGENRIAPGWIDFVPTPDGRFFVTPGPDDDGLTFYDARDVFAAVERNRSMGVEGIFTDARMRDQYPSVGILESGDAYVRYRVLTSWFRGLLYRDYEVRTNPSSGLASVRPLGEPVEPCEGLGLSTPIMSQDGREVAARHETTGTTKIFRILEAGRCEEVLDFGVPTSKVAWHASGQRIAFATPQRARGTAGGQGIFVFDRASGALAAVPGSGGASRLAFPDFVGEDAVVFLIPGATPDAESVFRLVRSTE